MQSTMAKFIFRCTRVPNAVSGHALEEIRADIKERIQAAQGTFGIAIDVSDIPGGRKIEITPTSAEGQMRMEGVTRWTMEMRRSGSEILVTSMFDVPDPMGALFKLMRVDPTSEQAKTEHEQIEQMLGVPKGTCQLI
jgi:hypothetical protein